MAIKDEIWDNAPMLPGIYDFEVHRAHTNPVLINEPYVFNRRFTHVSGDCFVHGEVRFPPNDELLSREYRTVFGPCFHSRTIMSNTSDDGLANAVKRITNIRKPEIPGYHERLVDNQYNMHLEYLEHWKHQFKEKLRHILVDLPDAKILRRMWTISAHPKKKLRLKAEQDMLNDGMEGVTRCKIVDYKAKKDELLPIGKKTRAIGDLTCPGSTVLGYYIDYVKEAFLNYQVNNCVATFIKSPDKDKMRDVFSNLMNKPGLYFCYFSDDSCLGCDTIEGRMCCNLDISQCDGSNFEPVFNILEEVMSVDSRYIPDIKLAFKQLELPLKIVSKDRRHKIILRPRNKVLYSGSVLTTITNNMANMLIFLKISEGYRPDLTKAEMSTLIRESAEAVGYILKVDLCPTYHGIQFLKHSPAIVDGMIEPYLNLGVWFRGFGHCVGDVPGRSRVPLAHRFAVYNSDVIRSRIHGGKHAISKAFQRFVLDDSYTVLESPVYGSQVVQDAYIPDQEIKMRYDLTDAEFDELIESINLVKPNQRVYNDAINKIFQLDYGYA